MSDCISIPAKATAGLSFKAVVALADYPAPDWALTLHLRGPAAIDIEGAPDGASHKLAADAATTSAWATGTYWWALRATDGDDAVEIDRGNLVVEPDMVAASAGYDGRSQAEVALAAIEAVLAKRATLDQERYAINNRELWRTPIADLIKLRTYYAALVRREKARAGGSSRWGRSIPVRFS